MFFNYSLLEYLNEIIYFSYKNLNFSKNYGNLIFTSRSKFSHFQCNGSMLLSKISKLSAMEIANIISVELYKNKIFSSVYVFDYLDLPIIQKTINTHI